MLGGPMAFSLRLWVHQALAPSAEVLERLVPNMETPAAFLVTDMAELVVPTADASLLESLPVKDKEGLVVEEVSPTEATYPPQPKVPPQGVTPPAPT